jgi:hypothetical protein
VEEEFLGLTLNLRVTAEDRARLDKLSGLLPRSAIARAALRLGLEQIEADPAMLLRPALHSRPLKAAPGTIAAGARYPPGRLEELAKVLRAKAKSAKAASDKLRRVELILAKAKGGQTLVFRPKGKGWGRSICNENAWVTEG